MERGGGKRKERKRKGGVGKGGVALAPRKKFPRAPTLQFITKLVIDGKLLIETSIVRSNFTAFIFNTSLTKDFHSKLKRPNCLGESLFCQQL